MPINLKEFRARSSKTFDLRAKAGAKSAELVLYGPVGASYFEESISAKQVSDALKNLEPSVNEINVRINSPGGDVFEGVAIYNRLRQHKAKIIVHVDGLAASIASIIMLAGDEIIVGEGALTMIHLPWTFAMGDRNALDNVVNRLMDVEEQMVSIYQKRMGMDRAEIKAMLEAETWMDADQAIEAGLADRKSEDSLPIAASVFDKAKWIHNAPKKFNSQAALVNDELKKLRQKIDAKLARK